MKKLIDLSKFQGEILKGEGMYNIKGGGGDAQQGPACPGGETPAGTIRSYQLADGTCIEKPD